MMKHGSMWNKFYEKINRRLKGYDATGKNVSIGSGTYINSNLTLVDEL